MNIKVWNIPQTFPICEWKVVSCVFGVTLLYTNLTNVPIAVILHQTASTFHIGAGVMYAKEMSRAVISATISIFIFIDQPRQILYMSIPTPFNPPQIMKLKLAPCHIPPNSMVIIMFRLVMILFLRSGRKTPHRIIAKAIDSTMIAIVILPDSITPIAAIAITQKNVPNVALRLPPNGI